MTLRNTGIAGATLVVGSFAAASVFAAESSLATTERVVVSATRSERSSFDLPVSIDRVDAEQIQDQQLQVNLSESLARVPGILVQNRQNYAQDLQISSRGFGARSTFGVRGIRLYADGIPATMPDGQGQAAHFDLGSADHIEILRGPFSSLYGNSSGGVISMFSEDGEPGVTLKGGLTAGSFGAKRLGLKAAGDTGNLNYVVSGSEYRTDGYRDHSAVKRDGLNAKLRLNPDPASSLTLVANAVDMPEAQDPGSLTRAQYEANPRQANPDALLYNTRERIAQAQGGMTYQRHLTTDDTLAATVYMGRRGITQYLSIPASAQTAVTARGGIIDLVRDYGGLDARWTRRATLAGEPLRFTAGLNYERVDENRLGFENFLGTSTAPQVLGVQGRLRRDEDNRIFNFDQYLQAEWQPSPAWLVLAGLRNSTVKVTSKDHYIVAGTANGDDSGNTRFSATNPVAGVTYKASERLNLYASYGRGFETPTLNELSYKASGPGLNFALNAAKSDHVEIGAKAFLSPDALLTAALFRVKTQDEIAVLTTFRGRSVFQNIGGTRRDGAELALDARLPAGFGVYAAYAYLRAVYANDFLTCTGAVCPAPNVPVPAGNALPGVPRSTLYAELNWKHAPSGFAGGIELRHVARIYVNDINSDAAPAYTTANLRAGFERKLGAWRAKAFYRMDNVADRKYVGSIVVNDGNGAFFEPSPGRNHLLGVSLSYAM